MKKKQNMVMCKTFSTYIQLNSSQKQANYCLMWLTLWFLSGNIHTFWICYLQNLARKIWESVGMVRKHSKGIKLLTGDSTIIVYKRVLLKGSVINKQQWCRTSTLWRLRGCNGIELKKKITITIHNIIKGLENLFICLHIRG